MNKIILIGNVCKDIETKYYNDRKYMKNTIAVRRDFKNKDGEYDSDFFNFTVWGNQAEYLDKFANKGYKIALCGRLMNNNYEKDGQTVYSNDIQVDSIEILTPRQGMTQEEAEQKAKELFGDDIVEVTNEANLLD